ncbi:hypothetical protein [Paenimyroides viscosum]|jgi:hypothetical protein|uniref:Lipocalin-like domain-containing protein n=1 Tax=Paenimyroides viscosum TaxID=2488729 RepID=A0A3P1B3P5_9FLAO|nr:hypothetical protein [Paenimyroides viscosum]RRA95787.1 hypothetical protein EG242_04980 [Paenimyroides viscosum]
MKNILGLFAFSALLVSCSKPISAEELKNLNGYWEISEVKTADGDNKEFQSNNNVDFFELKDLKGTRSKVVPQFNGKNQTNGIKEHFTVVDSANATYLKYATDYAKWTEKVDKLSKDELVIINDNDIKYTYKRFTPIVVNE